MLINVIEMIAHCRYNNIPVVIVSIDQAKAFDTVSHKFMHEVYKFFGLGPNFIQTLETLGNTELHVLPLKMEHTPDLSNWGGVGHKKIHPLQLNTIWQNK